MTQQLSSELQQAVEDNLDKVRRIAVAAHRRVPRHVDLDDLISVGTIALINAAILWDPEQTAKLSAYAATRVRGAVLDALRAMDTTPRSVRRILREMEAASTEPDEIGRIKQRAALAASARSVHLRIDDDREDSPRVEIVARENTDDQATTNAATNAMADAFNQLPDQHQKLIALYYYRGLTLAEAASQSGLTTPNASKIHARFAAEVTDKVRVAVSGRTT